MMYYEKKKHVKRQVYVDTLYIFDVILLKGRVSLKSHTSERGNESAISLIFLLLQFNAQSLGLWFWLTTVSETPPGFLKMNFNFSFKD